VRPRGGGLAPERKAGYSAQEAPVGLGGSQRTDTDVDPGAQGGQFRIESPRAAPQKPRSPTCPKDKSAMTDAEDFAGRLRDPQAGVRREAVAALGRTRDPRWAPTLAEALHDRDRDVRDAAVSSLIEIGGDAVAEAVAPSLNSPDREIRTSAAEVLQEAERSADDPLISLLDGPDEETKILALDLLGATGGPKAVDAAIAALGDASPGVRNAAASSLGALGGTRAVDPLCEMVSSEEDEWVAFAAVQALRETSAGDISAALAAALRRGGLLAAAAVSALAEVGGPDAVSVLLRHLPEASDDAASHIIAATCEIADRCCDPAELPPGVRADLVRLLTDASTSHPDEWTRYRAVQTLGRFHCGEAEDLLLSLVGGGSPLVRLASAEALGRIGGGRAEGALMALSDDRDRDIAQVAREALMRATGGAGGSREG